MIEAAGGVVVRTVSDRRVEVLLVHRPRRRDWSLPKGKLDGDETAIECALREVREETGLTCRLGPQLPGTCYIDRKGRQKRVRYWAMEAEYGTFTPNDEVDEVRWVPADGAGGLLTYDRDLTVVAGLAVVLATSAA